jgi:hypothetical protein
LVPAWDFRLSSVHPADITRRCTSLPTVILQKGEDQVHERSRLAGFPSRLALDARAGTHSV